MAQARPFPAASRQGHGPARRPRVSRSLAAVCRALTVTQLERLSTGGLQVIEAGSARVYGAPEPEATLIVHDPALYIDVVVRGSVGFGEAFVAGRWSSPDLVALVRMFLKNRDLLSRLEGGVATVLRSRDALLNAARRNTPDRSRVNVGAHYDLGNDFFELVLDPTLSYSCAVFESDEASLEDASRTKIARVLDKLGIGRHSELLEIGTGWGALAIAAAERGARVTTTTVSREQLTLARRRILGAGVSRRVELLDRDWRQLTGAFDRIASIEMIEAVGYAYYVDFFRKSAELLVPGGRMLVQAIVVDDDHFEWAKDRVDFVKKHIFPGSCLPSVRALSQAAGEGSDLTIADIEDLTEHYPRTLRSWRERLLSNRSAITALGYRDELVRSWEYYLSYCEAGFAERHIRVVQIVLERPR